MCEPIRLPDPEPLLSESWLDFDGCIIIKRADGEPLEDVLGKWEPLTLTCIPSDAIMVETDTLNVPDTFNLEDPL